MYLVDEQHVARLERGEYAGKVAGTVEHRAAGYLEAHAQLVGDDVRQRGLAKARRAVKQRVVERFATVFRSLDKDFKVVNHGLLSAEISEMQRPQRVLEVLLGRRAIPLPDVKRFVHYGCKVMK